MSPFESSKNSEVLEATVPAAGAAVVQDQVIGRAPIAGKVAGVSIAPEAAVVANATNFRTIRVINKGQAGAGAVVVASLPLDTPGTRDLAAFDEKDIPLSGTDANLVVAAGDILVADETVAGTGLAHSGYRIQVQIVK